MIKLLIFDLDGTLINSIDDLADSVNHALTENDFPVHELNKFNMFVGNGVQKLIERALPDNCRDSETILKVKSRFDFYYNQNYCNKTKPYDGINQLLEKIWQNGIMTAVASNKPDNFTKKIVSAFWKDKFTNVYGNREGVAKKPDPECVHIIMNELSVTTEEVIFIGDSNVDIITAKNAGLKSIGCLWGFRTRKELEDSGADFIASHPLDIITYIDSMIK